MEEKYPKVLLALGFLVLLVVLSAFIPASWFGIKPAQKQYTKLIIPDANDLKVLAGDTNKDGEPDWRNLMQKTYQEIKTTSAQETGATSNTLDTTSGVSKEDQAKLDDPNNLTASFAKNMYVVTAYMKEKGVTDQKAQQDMFNSVLDQEATKISIPLYTEKDILLDTKETVSAVATYSKQIQSIAALGAKYGFGSGDLEIVQNYMDTKKPDVLKPLATKASNADIVIKKLQDVSVPPSAVGMHLNALNRLSVYKVTLEGLSKTDSDPVRGTLAARQYENTVSLLLKALLRFDEYFKAHDIIVYSGAGVHTFIASTYIPLYTN